MLRLITLCAYRAGVVAVMVVSDCRIVAGEGCWRQLVQVVEYAGAIVVHELFSVDGVTAVTIEVVSDSVHRRVVDENRVLEQRNATSLGEVSFVLGGDAHGVGVVAGAVGGHDTPADGRILVNDTVVIPAEFSDMVERPHLRSDAGVERSLDGGLGDGDELDVVSLAVALQLATGGAVYGQIGAVGEDAVSDIQVSGLARHDDGLQVLAVGEGVSLDDVGVLAEEQVVHHAKRHGAVHAIDVELSVDVVLVLGVHVVVGIPVVREDHGLKGGATERVLAVEADVPVQVDVADELVVLHTAGQPSVGESAGVTEPCVVVDFGSAVLHADEAPIGEQTSNAVGDVLSTNELNFDGVGEHALLGVIARNIAVNFATQFLRVVLHERIEEAQHGRVSDADNGIPAIIGVGELGDGGTLSVSNMRHVLAQTVQVHGHRGVVAPRLDFPVVLVPVSGGELGVDSHALKQLVLRNVDVLRVGLDGRFLVSVLSGGGRGVGVGDEHAHHHGDGEQHGHKTSDGFLHGSLPPCLWGFSGLSVI